MSIISDRPALQDAGADRVALLALLRLRPDKITWSEIASEAALRGSAVSLWEDFFAPALDGMGGAEENALADAAETWAEWDRADFDVLTVLDAEYPVSLKAIHQVPPLLFTRGEVRPVEAAVSVVGSRNASDEGLRIAANVARGLAERGVTVLSGLAAGIDAAAHQATLDAGGRTVGVIGTGITKTYPAANKKLHQTISERGALVSQFMPDAPPQKHNFPMRNATMSGMGLASVVVEAGEHSGARIQARVAVEHGRPVILTDLVVNNTQWGRDLLNRPGVFRASATSEVMRIVERIVEVGDESALPVLQ
ncbi:DprA-like DNA processing chain A [Gordonia phage Vasanti]|uniref:DprA-like DNA processing chain A n=1 Tax=Gordonia phage Vasanti TaxID=2502431 RepID=A0A411BVY8_9CAUD|nr:DprA-like DNA processing chain A [Gordonia phage Vasanti]QAY05768.1 DprA-like DNA processing chain A [Gordonia phage Vasanti]